jgi:hypothetical protein
MVSRSPKICSFGRVFSARSAPIKAVFLIKTPRFLFPRQDAWLKILKNS